MQFLKKHMLLIVAIFIALLSSVIYFQTTKMARMKIDLVLKEEKVKVLSNNIKVSNEKAIFWKTKDGTNVVTAGLLNADNKMFKEQYKDLDKKFNALIKDNSKGIVRMTYLENQLEIKDSLMAKIKSRTPSVGSSYIKNDSTIVINDEFKVDTRNYRKTSGSIVIAIDSNRIMEANVNLNTIQGLGVDMATYKDKEGIDRVSVGTKYPNTSISVSGIVDIEKRMKELKEISEARSKSKSKFGIGLHLGLGYGSGTQQLKPQMVVGVGLNFNLFKLK